MGTRNPPISPSDGRRAHPEYYLTGGDLYFQIDTTLLCVHSYFFRRDSEKFAEMLDAPIKRGDFKPGTKENPILITDLTLEELESFLWVYYNRKYDDYSEASAATYIAILRVSHEFDFPSVKAFAINGLESRLDITLSQRIALYRHYHVDKKFIIPLFIQAILREDVDWISDEEIEDIGMPTSTYLFRARERLLRATNGGTSEWTEKNARKALVNAPGKSAIFSVSGSLPSPHEPEQVKPSPEQIKEPVNGNFAPPGPSN